VRDSLHSGTVEYGTIDVERLMKTSFFMPPGLHLHINSLPALRSALISKLTMYETVYYHKTARSINITAEELLLDTLKYWSIENPLEDLQSFCGFDEFALFGRVQQWSNQLEDSKKKKLGGDWLDLFNRQLFWKEAFYLRCPIRSALISALADQIPRQCKQSLVKKLNDLKANSDRVLVRDHGFTEKEAVQLRSTDISKVQILVDTPALDVRPENPFQNFEEKVYMYNPKTGDVDAATLLNLLTDLPLRACLKSPYKD
jgi:HD superfamily phosphohydrolase